MGVVNATGPGAAHALRSEFDQGTKQADSSEIEVVKLNRLWKIGGDSESEQELFGVITDIAVDAGGNVFLLDLQLSEVKVFSPEGEYSRTIGREGEGPGEFRSPRKLFFTPHEKLCVLQSMPTRLSLFDPEGQYLGDLNLPSLKDGGFQYVIRANQRGGTMVVQGIQTQMGEGLMDQISRVTSFNQIESELIDLARATRHIDFANMKIREIEADPLRWTIGPNGLVYLSNDYDYEIEILHPDGTFVRKVERDYPHRTRSKEEIDEVRAYFARGGGAQGATIEVEEHHRDIEWFEIADNGSIWVLNSRGVDAPQGSGVIGTFDLFDVKGRYTGQIQLQGEGNLRRDRCYLKGGRFYVVTQYEPTFRSWSARAGQSASSEDDDTEESEDLEPMAIICYEIPEGLVN